MNLKTIGTWFIGIILVIIGITILPPTFLALLTIFGLIGFFLFRSWKKRKTMSGEGKRFSKKMLTATGVGLLFVVAFVLFVYLVPENLTPKSDSKPIQKETTSQQKQIVFINESYIDLWKVFNYQSQYTNLQKEAIFNSQYKGKYVKWTGKVKNIDTTLFTDKIVLWVEQREKSPFDFSGSDVSVYISKDQYGKLIKLKKGDAVIGISTSGNSKNVIKAVEKAKELGGITVGFTGRKGGMLKDKVDICLNVPSDDTPRIQEGYMLAGHIICELVEQKLVEEGI